MSDTSGATDRQVIARGLNSPQPTDAHSIIGEGLDRLLAPLRETIEKAENLTSDNVVVSLSRVARL